jgi:sugar phosphate isomerase/epimerase
MIDEIRSAGFDTVELGFSLTRSMVDEVLRMSGDGAVKVSSLHNMCPLPPEIPPDRASPDYYSLSSTDRAERERAVRAAKETISCAASFGARAVVIHAGRVPIDERTRELAAKYDDEELAQAIRREMAESRRRLGRAYLGCAIESIGELVAFAKDAGIPIGIENRYYYREIPLIDELDEIFGRFGEGELYYWHDTGHAEVFDRLGLAGHSELLRRFSGRLIGMHLHDIIGRMTDHRTPGDGTFDFGIVRPYINESTILVMEVHRPATAEDLRRGLKHLESVLGIR